jgi:hypothetical protein
MPASRQPRISQRHRWYQWLVLTGILCAAFAVMPAQAETPASGPVPPALTATPAGVGATATPSSELRFAFGDATLRLPTGTEKGTVHLTISAEATGKEPVPAGEIEVVDIKQLGPTVDFKRVAEYQSSGKGRIWFLKADVSALPINSVPLTRSALVSLGEFKRIVPYVLTNRPASAPDFSITPPALWQRNSDNEVAAALLVAAGEQALLGLRLAHVSLTEKTQQQRSIPLQALELCTLPTDDVCVAPPVIPAQSSQTVYLRFKKGEKFWAASAAPSRWPWMRVPKPSRYPLIWRPRRVSNNGSVALSLRRVCTRPSVSAPGAVAACTGWPHYNPWPQRASASCGC